MIDLVCSCGHCQSVPESSLGQTLLCPQCQTVCHLACGEELPPGSGAGDFDACLTVVSGPAGAGERFYLGGVASIDIGKLPTTQIHLSGNKVSRTHCQLDRVDFGPSRWRITDTHATWGTIINGQKVQQQELTAGDTLQLGEFSLRYDLLEPPAQPPAPPVPQHMVVVPAASLAGEHVAKLAHAESSGAVHTEHAPATTLSYASQATDAPRLLGDCDIGWVMSLRNASTLMVWTLIANTLSVYLSMIPLAPTLLALGAAGMSLVAVWLLTAPEPNVRDNWLGVRGFLRIFGVAACGGELLMIFGMLFNSAMLGNSGSYLWLASIPQTILFLFYLRRLALRLPNVGLANCALVVMIALPLVMGMIAWNVIRSINAARPDTVTTGVLIILAYLVFRGAFAGLLIWFNRSFS